jgi:hypothetical protein
MNIDTTQIQTWQACPMKYYLQFICGLKKVEEGITDIDLRFGSSVHKCLEVYYKGKGITNEQIEEVWKGFIDLPESYEEKSKTRENGIKLCTDYTQLYEGRDKDWEILGVEKLVRIPIGDDTYVVKLDLIIKVNGNVYAVEHKTTSRISPTYFAKFTPNTQISAQTAAVSQEFGECSGVIINALESGWVTKPVLIAPEDSDTGNYSIKEVKYCKYYSKEMAYCSGFHSNFQREIINRTKEQVADFKVNVQMEIAKLKTDVQMGLFGKHEQRCHDYKNGCQFKELCISCADESVLSNLYEKCDPYEYLKEEQNGILSVPAR